MDWIWDQTNPIDWVWFMEDSVRVNLRVKLRDLNFILQITESQERIVTKKDFSCGSQDRKVVGCLLQWDHRDASEDIQE